MILRRCFFRSIRSSSSVASYGIASLIRRRLFSSSSSSFSSIPSTCSSFQLNSFPPSPSSPLDFTIPIENLISTHTTIDSTTPIPSPGPNELLIKFHSVAINPLDLFHIRGYGHQLYSSSSLFSLNSLPFPLGRDGSGEIISMGSNIMDFNIGDRICVSRNPLRNGIFSEYSIIKREECCKIPINLSMKQSAAIPFALTTAWSALVIAGAVIPHELNNSSSSISFSSSNSISSSNSSRHPIRIPPITNPIIKIPGQIPFGSISNDEREFYNSLQSFKSSESLPGLGLRALIHGSSGPVGITALQLLANWGWSITCTVRDQNQMDYIESILNHTGLSESTEYNIINTSISNFHYKNSFNESEYDIILDCVGGEESEEMGLYCIKSNGRFITLRGNLISNIDSASSSSSSSNGSILSGIGNSIMELLYKNKKFISKNQSLYCWAINQPELNGLEYGKKLIEMNKLIIPLDSISENQFNGIQSIGEAMKYYDSQKPNGKVVISLISNNNNNINNEK